VRKSAQFQPQTAHFFSLAQRLFCIFSTVQFELDADLQKLLQKYPGMVAPSQKPVYVGRSSGWIELTPVSAAAAAMQWSR